MIQGNVHGCARHTLCPSALMASLNHCIMSRSIRAIYPTAFLATVDRDGRLAFTNGGHTRPLLIRRGGAVEELAEGGPLLGLLEDFAYPPASRQLHPGDLLFLYTDGVTDAENSRGEVFGESRLRAWAEDQAGRHPADVKQSLLATLTAFSGGCAQSDDLTALLAQYRGNA
jgi:sigma-B regulation protein RsbU (phosphoserine phosphatase)